MMPKFGLALQAETADEFFLACSTLSDSGFKVYGV